MANQMPHMSDSIRNVFADANSSAGLLEYTADELKRIAKLAEELKAIIHTAKERSRGKS